MVAEAEENEEVTIERHSAGYAIDALCLMLEELTNGTEQLMDRYDRLQKTTTAALRDLDQMTTERDMLACEVERLEQLLNGKPKRKGGSK